jgi:hypothetical protein
MTAFEDMETAIGAMRAGAHDYLVKPLDLDRLEMTLERALRDRVMRQRLGRNHRRRGRTLRAPDPGRPDPAMIEIYKRIGALATSPTPVLIRGETGTGKEVIARAIHFNSQASAEPFVAINCTAVPEALLESELFGHVRGAFTGASATAGDDSSWPAAARSSSMRSATSLRVPGQAPSRVAGSGVSSVGGERARRSEARVIAATHAPIEERVRQGQFREDLYFPPPRRRDRGPAPPRAEGRYPLLMEHLIARIGSELHRAIHLTPAALDKWSTTGGPEMSANWRTRCSVRPSFHPPVFSRQTMSLSTDRPEPHRPAGRRRPTHRRRAASCAAGAGADGGNKRRPRASSRFRARASTGCWRDSRIRHNEATMASTCSQSSAATNAAPRGIP